MMTPPFAIEISSISGIEAVQQVLEVVCRTTGLGFAAVVHVTESRWVACAVRDELERGLKVGDEVPVETTICHEIRLSGQGIAIDYVADDPVYCQHHTPRLYGFDCYISLPIILSDGRFFGTLLALDVKRANLKTPEITGMFRLFASLVAHHLDSMERDAANAAALLNERETAKLREQFIAVLGHDLRNPLMAISSGLSVLRALPGNEENTRLIDTLMRSSGRMEGLIGDVLDFAQGRLGGGIDLKRHYDGNLVSALELVISELESTSPTRPIYSTFAVEGEVFCDSARLGQMLSNLLANAIKHGTPDTPIWVCVQTQEDQLEIAVTNEGPELAPAIREQLFQPFARGKARPGRQGLGLGLYIAAEIARAHDGTLEVETENGKIRFVFKMPLIRASD